MAPQGQPPPKTHFHPAAVPIPAIWVKEHEGYRRKSVVGGSRVVPNVGLVVKGWLEWRREQRGGPARELGGGDMAHAARGAGMSRLQAKARRLIIRRAVGRCPAGSGWRWAGGGRVRGGMGPDLDRGEADRRKGAERLALMDRAWEDVFEETDYATQDGSGGGTQESEGTQREQSGQASGGAGEAGAMASRLLESMEDVRREAEHLGTVGGQGRGTAEARSGGARAGTGGLIQAASSVEDILNEWDDLLSPGPGSGVWTQEQRGASPEQAMALAEGGVATLMGASRRVAGLLGGVDGMGGTDEDDGGDVGRSRVELTHAGPLRARGPIPAAMTTYNRLHGSIRHLISFRAHGARLLAVPELTAQVGGGGASSDEGNPVYHSQPLETALGHSGRGVGGQALLRPGSGACRGQRVVPNVGLVVKRWFKWQRQKPEVRWRCDAEGLGWLSEA
ncbi:hypothetical protein CYMTET_4840 [Cymbomonas tetramitiformis]|uniref:Uncharacterized protein n=1 Tax=Cymbomonas tetramitiformis TaxID=36881 RepID=A0AAE0LJP1_9CHLO|nr:hypothetical protein CYMTET_4840 [Cymbomonas tetramitiformis]